jgi:hypothetical protein
MKNCKISFTQQLKASKVDLDLQTPLKTHLR